MRLESTALHVMKSSFQPRQAKIDTRNSGLLTIFKMTSMFSCWRGVVVVIFLILIDYHLAINYNLLYVDRWFSNLATN